MSTETIENVAEKKSRSASRHNKMKEATLFLVINTTPKEVLEGMDYKKENGVLFMKAPGPSGHRESYTVKQLQHLAIGREGEFAAKVAFMLAEIKRVNEHGNSPSDLYGKTFPVSVNGRNKSALVPGVGTLFGIKDGMIFATYEPGKVTLTLTAPASSGGTVTELPAKKTNK